MARHELVATYWDEPVPGASTGYVRHRCGALIDVPEEHVARLLQVGAIVPADTNEDGDEPRHGADDHTAGAEGDDPTSADGDGGETAVSDPEQDAADGTPPAQHQRPKHAAPKPVWVEYAVARGMDREAADALDKRELIAALA